MGTEVTAKAAPPIPMDIASQWTVFVFAAMAYDRIHARKHALVESCARLGFDAVYVEPPASTSPRHAAAGPLTLNGSGVSLSPPAAPMPVGERQGVLAVPKKLGMGPLRLSLGRRRDEAVQAAWLQQFFARYRAAHPGRRVLAIVASARWERLVRDVPFDLLVVDKTDVPSTLAGWLGETEYLERERALLARSALVMAASPALRAAAKRTAPNTPTLLVSNGVDLAHFDAHANDPTPELAELPRPIVGFLGTVAHWVDFPLLAACAKAHPTWSFPVFGPVNHGLDLTALERLPNVRFFGKIAYDRVPAIMHGFDVGLMPFLPWEATNPVTMYEFLTTGRPLVITRSDEYAHLQELVYMSPAGVLADLERAAAEDDADLRARRRAAAREYAWDTLFGAALAQLPLAAEEPHV